MATEQMRPVIFAANWKMHHGPLAAREFVETFTELVGVRDGRTLWFFPPATTLGTVAHLTVHRPDIQIGAQHVHAEAKGAFTGEVSIPLVQEVGATGALVGHSERRHLFGETDEQTHRQVRALLDAGMTAMLCVGELLAEREAGRTAEVVQRQLTAALSGIEALAWDRLIIAYEPVWAIGTGRNATPADAAEVHREIRTVCAALGRVDRQPVLYGGSVNAACILKLLAESEIDGVLVGGASLDADGWAGLVGFGA
jgi:triosephosphate isomerase